MDKLIVGGGIANTFLAATGINVGKSLHEAEMLDMARKLLEQAKARGAEIPLPTDVVGGQGVRGHGACRRAQHPRRASRRDDPRHRAGYRGAVRRDAADAPAPSSGTVRWACSSSISSAKAPRPSRRRSPKSPAFSLAGGGDTLAAIEKYGVEEGISYIRTGGGAFLEFVEGKTLPAVAMLQSRANGK